MAMEGFDKPEDASIETLVMRVQVAVDWYPHRGHEGIPGAEDNSCFRCNADRALAELKRRADGSQ